MLTLAELQQEIADIRLDGHKGPIAIEVFTDEGLELLASVPSESLEEIVELTAQYNLSLDDLCFSY